MNANYTKLNGTVIKEFLNIFKPEIERGDWNYIYTTCNSGAIVYDRMNADEYDELIDTVENTINPVFNWSYFDDDTDKAWYLYFTLFLYQTGEKSLAKSLPQNDYIDKVQYEEAFKEHALNENENCIIVTKFLAEEWSAVPLEIAVQTVKYRNEYDVYLVKFADEDRFIIYKSGVNFNKNDFFEYPNIVEVYPWSK